MRFTKGDHLKAMRVGYAHHGIYAGDGKVLHYLDDRGICECSLEEFAGGMPTVAVTYLILDTFSPDEIVRRAYSRMGESGYSLVFQNCEHFATWCACGLEHSGQVQRATAAMAGAGMFAARRVFAGAAGNAVLGGTATATAVGAGTTAKLGAAGLGAAGMASAPVLLVAGAALALGLGFACLLADD
ncbi:putative Cell wall-associated hydrolases (Invasion-associated proteins) [uncultured delta proteobacterium]|uniref:Putative Cell wall-associated hydrolases (Invasion-associated proteins) n=1 Tax=uncultured delta proteobacterium TaxID=34034 RepID=A0A212JMT1_9DELT|nr:putative Cell wall-associated hydrolases (Invasion-associated proteins) [uncultured delta proteobacterium]